MENQLDAAIVVRPGGGTRVGNVEFLARSEDTARFNLSIVEIRAGADGPPPHAHDAEDDAFYVLAGELTIEAGGEKVIATPGTFVLIPPGVVHTFSNHTGEPASVLNVHAPAGFDRRLREDG